MIGKLLTRIKEAVEAAQRPAFDPAERFPDELAGRIDWTPAAAGGSNFGTHKLVEVAPERMEFRASIGLYLFGGIFAAVGLAVLVVFGAGLITGGRVGPDIRESVAAMILLPVFGLVFGGVGLAIMCLLGRPRVFDLAAGCYWKGRRRPAGPGAASSAGDEPNPYAQPLSARARRAGEPAVTDEGPKPRRVALADVHAIQLLRERCTSSGKNSSSYWSYELNLVLHDGRRVNVVDHGNHARIVADARRIGERLGVPVWDAT